MKRAAIIVAALALVSCGAPKIECTREGMIIIPEGTDNKTASEWALRNMELANARLGQVTGFEDNMREHLVKAQGCP